ncbi:MAG: hypothetical protein PWR03_410 [Tenuifilum sp.]|uniref:type IX secretion system anionic LPS delivery protein PorZ n=1 Tax=Tenuifilum sp. TaxID=2760880 RepID=UPI0024AA2593|nr:two-component regulator propeller domain-containing protein [Tenuifilum sp.]MDI3526227.1 hypothetical protein [Tenuifilum sp.]
MNYRVKLLVLLLFCLKVSVFGQPPVGKWTDYFSFNNARSVSSTGNMIYCASENGFFTYRITTGEINKFTKTNGLSEVDLTAITYIPELKLTVVGYKSGNIDFIFDNGTIKELPFIKDKPMSGSKQINHFLYYNSLIYTSTDFGIVVIDVENEEVKDTYYVVQSSGSVKVRRLAVWNQRFWAATSDGIYSADVTDPLLISYERWTKEAFFSNPSAECVSVASNTNSIVAVERGVVSDIVWANSGTGWFEVDRALTEVVGLAMSNKKFWVYNKNEIQAFLNNWTKAELINSYSFGVKPNVSDCTPVDDNDFLAVADQVYGLVLIGANTDNVYLPSGPFNNKFFHVDASSSLVVAASGAYDAAMGNVWLPFIAHRFNNGSWNFYADWSVWDAVKVKFDPNKPNHYFVASWGGGLYEFEGDELVEHYTPENSSLQSVFPGQAFCRIAGVDFDQWGNIWVANSEVSNPISVRSTNGDWFSFPYASAIGTPKILSLTISRDGLIWLALARDNGLFVLNPGGDIQNSNDDVYLKFRPRDVNGNLLPNEISFLTFDRDGYLWLGTNQGVLVTYNPSGVFQGEALFTKIKIPDVVEGLAVYLLENEEVTCIEVDGGNRKWFGTSKSGVYLFSEDGTEQIYHFTSDNSPLPSNTILSIKVHPLTGEVFIATDKGLVSFRGDASEPANSFGKVYAFPNPVRENYNGLITIAGLMENSVVKITDLSGNLVYETRSNGGYATWNGRNGNGTKVATGVYLVFCSDSKGDQSVVTKLLFIK